MASAEFLLRSLQLTTYETQIIHNELSCSLLHSSSDGSDMFMTSENALVFKVFEKKSTFFLFPILGERENPPHPSVYPRDSASFD